MLVLTRKRNESIIAGVYGEIKFTILGVINDCVKVGIEAPLEIPIHREEIYLAIQKSKQKIKNITNDKT